MRNNDLYPGITSRSEIEELREAIVSDYVEADPKDTIYHYTDAAGLLGIIQNKNIWCTDIEYMNDADELNYAKELIKRRLDEFGKKYDKDSEYFEVLERNLYKSYTDAFNIHIACFSEEKDISSQWTSYGNYCIGFNCKAPFKTDKLADKASFSSSWQRARFGKVIYSREVQEAIVDKIIERLYELFKKDLESSEIGYEKEAFNSSIDFSELIFQFLILFKRDSFEHEREWRLIHLVWENTDLSLGMSESDVKFRSVNDHLRPYVESGIRIFDKEKESGIYRKEFEDSEMYGKEDYDFDDYMRETGKFPINYVGIGPVRYLDIAKNSVQRVLNKYGFSDAKISASSSKIRSNF